MDPANRLVADSLEADWNNKLRALTAAQEQYEEQRKIDRAAISEQQRASIAALAHDFPRLWQNPKTPDRERKRLVRLLLEDVTYPKRADHGPRSIQGRDHENADSAATSQLLANKNDPG